MSKNVLSHSVVSLADAGFVRVKMFEDFSIEIYVGIAGDNHAISYDAEIVSLLEDFKIVLTPLGE